MTFIYIRLHVGRFMWWLSVCTPTILTTPHVSAMQTSQGQAVTLCCMRAAQELGGGYLPLTMLVLGRALFPTGWPNPCCGGPGPGGHEITGQRPRRCNGQSTLTLEQRYSVPSEPNVAPCCSPMGRLAHVSGKYTRSFSSWACG